MAKRPPRDIEVPPDNYTAVERQMMRLRGIPARLEAERLIAEKFGLPPPSEQTGIFESMSPELAAEALRQRQEWDAWEREQIEVPAQSLWSRLMQWLGLRSK